MDTGKKGDFRLRLIDPENGKPKTITLYSNKEPVLDELIKRVVGCVRED